MSTNRAKILTDQQLDRVLTHIAAKSRDPLRDYVIVLLSFKAGFRACEIAGIRPTDVLDAGGDLAAVITVPDAIAKNGKGRTIPMHPSLKIALDAYLKSRALTLRSNLITGLPSVAERNGAPFVSSNAIQVYLKRLYTACGLNGVSSHSGRRTFLTRAAQRAGSVGCSLKDVQRLAGHSSITTTEIYVEPSEQQAKLVGAL